jgi:predicted RNA-binding Zn ribbon-like protein
VEHNHLDTTWGHSTDGQLCLEFTNTVGARDTDTPNERLQSYSDLVAWGEQVGFLGPHAAAQLRQVGEERSQESSAVLRSAVALREVLYRIFTAHAEEVAPQREDLMLLNRALERALPHLQLAVDQDGFVWQWQLNADDLDQVLWPVARSASELLTSGDLARVRECAGEHCTWLFIDRSKNHSRRWCDMQECGNVAKVRRYRSRKRAASERSSPDSVP